MVRAIRYHSRSALKWLFGSMLFAGVLITVSVAAFHSLVAAYSENLFYPMVIVVLGLVLLMIQNRMARFGFFTGAVAEGMLGNVFWSGYQMGDWRWSVTAGFVMLALGGLVWRVRRGVAEMKYIAIAIWLISVFVTWQLLRPIFRH